MSVARTIAWMKANALAQALLSREQRTKIARAKAERVLQRAKDPNEQPRVKDEKKDVDDKARGNG